MTDRIIEIADTAAFLSLDNGLLKIKLPTGDITSVPVSEIQCLILANPAVTITGALLAGLASAGVITVISGSNRWMEITFKMNAFKLKSVHRSLCGNACGKQLSVRKCHIFYRRIVFSSVFSELSYIDIIVAQHLATDTNIASF